MRGNSQGKRDGEIKKRKRRTRTIYEGWWKREKQLNAKRWVEGARGGGQDEEDAEEEVASSTFLIQGEAIKMTEPLLARADLYPFTTQRVPDKK